MNKKNIIKIIIIVAILAIGYMSFSYQQKNKVIADIGIDANNKLLKHFQEKYPDNKVLKCGYEDINEDGRKDLVVIFYKEVRSNGMVVVLDTEEGYKITDEVPAPIENQSIEFKNIDEEGPMEFIVSGSKDGRYGYAIFRLVDLEIHDIFGEGMEDCC